MKTEQIEKLRTIWQVALAKKNEVAKLWREGRLHWSYYEAAADAEANACADYYDALDAA